MRCLGCRYNLKGLAEHRCPECGRAFDPSDRNTFETRKPMTKWEAVVFFGLLALAMIMLALLT